MRSVLEVFETSEQRNLAREIACKSMVLLNNDGLLPLLKTIKPRCHRTQRAQWTQSTGRLFLSGDEPVHAVDGAREFLFIDLDLDLFLSMR